MIAIAFGSAVAPVAANADSSVFAFKEMSARWWQWALSIPVASNPLFDPTTPGDPTAVNCMVGQHGTVWFLAGATSSGTIRRTCSVPEGVTLFYPVLNSINFNTPGICGQGSGDLTVAELRALVAPAIDGATGLEAKVDGVAQKMRRVRSIPFVAVLPKDNLFVAPCGGDAPPGVFSPAVDDGYYVKVDPLARGVHTIEFKGTNAYGFALDVGYTLTVVPVSSEVWH